MFAARNAIVSFRSRPCTRPAGVPTAGRNGLSGLCGTALLFEWPSL